MAWSDRLVARLLQYLPGLGAWLTGRALGEEPPGSPPRHPFTPFDRTIEETSLLLITTGGVHLPDQDPFDMALEHGDPSYRRIPRDAERFEISHDYYDSRDAGSDINCLFPLPLLNRLADRGLVGEPAPVHLSLMGHVEDPALPRLVGETIPDLVQFVKTETGPPDLVLLAPA